MRFDYLTNLPLEEAQILFAEELKNAGFGAGSEEISVQDACGRITADPVYAHISAPHYLASAMDGIALKAEFSFGATETTPVKLSKEQYTVVDTGDPIPEGMDAVIMIEELSFEEDGSVTIYEAAIPWQHIRQIGEDICAGEMILTAHMPITPSSIGAMLATGNMKLSVLKKPVIGIIPTGDEIVMPCDDPKPGDIIEFNSSIFSAMLKEMNAEPKTYPIAKDTYEAIRGTLEKAIDECDIVLINAGSSAGRDDLSASIISDVGKCICHGVAIKPGKPAILGLAAKRNTAIIGVPGYPVSGILVLEQFLKPVLDNWFFRTESPAEIKEAVLTKNIVSGLKYREFVRVRAGYVGDRLIASALNRGSGVVSSFMKADGIMEIPQGVEGYEAGDKVQIRLMRPDHELRNTVVIIGSHDPLLDEVANMLHIAEPGKFISSSHVGSMGGIMAAKRKENHLAGIHLLDETDGSYNTSYIKKYLAGQGVRLVECVQRVQGLMVAAGNPLSIRSIADLGRGVRYVNRQRGSGTRILIDFLLKKENMDPAAIDGYEREETTHTAVAAQIASGTADAGMGIYSAAKLYGLDFIPICLEQYDLLIPDYAWENPSVQAVIKILQSREFAERLTEMGGYELDKPGRVREHFPA